MERTDAVTFKGRMLTLSGEELVPGKSAPDFTAVDNDLNETGLGGLPDGINVIASVPSLDTPVCDLEIKRFNSEAVSFSGKVNVTFISMDLPFAQKRFCETFGIDRVRTLSDHRDADFGRKYGVLIKELRLLARAIFLVDAEGVLRYTQYVGEISDHPDYDEALKALRKLV
ncbi:MAG: thiol peroxidase [Candidatus Omnitrophica bacterium]|nr:thiol peroxidase [Candidatus Omnitrophota bacterium]